MKPCPGRCGKEIGNKKFACKTCWNALPLGVRGDITDAWDSFQLARGGKSVTAMVEAAKGLGLAHGAAHVIWASKVPA